MKKGCAMCTEKTAHLGGVSLLTSGGEGLDMDGFQVA